MTTVTIPQLNLTEAMTKRLEDNILIDDPSPGKVWPDCDCCGKPCTSHPWHFSTDRNKHLHACDGCWELMKS